MEKDILSFLEVTKRYDGEANDIANQIIFCIIAGFKSVLGMDYKNYANLRLMIQDGIDKQDHQSYFWNWMQEYGQEGICSFFETDIEDTAENLDKLDMQLFLVQSDIDNKITTSFFESVASFLASSSEGLTKTYGA